uniref:Uncharacterized protein n=1 Tax=Cacopsylla melanoneura TaxID=428564 RepID=A0A8D8LVS4_9HEMI
MSSHQQDPFDFLDSHESCYMCNGFYGPNFNEPVCSTCHLFLYPDDLSQEQPDVVLSCIKDDGNDSGNECDCPQDRADSIKTPPLSCCSYNNLSGVANISGFIVGDAGGPSDHNPLGEGGGNNPYQGGGGGEERRRGRRRRREEGEEREDEAESSDSLTSDEELPAAAGAVPPGGGHYVFNVPGRGGGNQHSPPPLQRRQVNHAQRRNSDAGSDSELGKE